MVDVSFVLAKILDNLHIHEPKLIGNKTKILIGGDTFTKDPPAMKLLKTLIPQDTQDMMGIDDYLSLSEKYEVLFYKMKERIERMVLDNIREGNALRYGCNFLSREGFPVAEVKLYFDPRHKFFGVCNPATQSFFEASPADVKNELSLRFPKNDMLQEYIDKARVAVGKVYSPERPSLYCKQEGEDLGTFNIYVPPTWTKYRDELPSTQKPTLHPLLDKFFNHLIPEGDCRNNIFHWISNLLYLFKDPIPLLVLYGHAGIGKNTLVEKILLPLVGKSNFHRSASVQERFNSSVKNCVLFFSDEGEVKGFVKRNFKGFHEGEAAIELKGVDVDEPERLYARFVIATNELTDISLNEQDRKFSVPELIDKKLEAAMTIEEIEWLRGFPDNIEAQVEFAAWLKNNYNWEVSVKAWQKDLFKRICYESRTEWFKQFHRMCVDNETFALKDLRKSLGGMNIGTEKIKSAIDNYRHETGLIIASVEHTNKGANFISSIYDPSATGY